MPMKMPRDSKTLSSSQLIMGTSLNGRVASHTVVSSSQDIQRHHARELGERDYEESSCHLQGGKPASFWKLKIG
jgi:hypothetical protein